MADYVLEGPRWGTGGLGTSGGTVTWAADGTVPSSFLSIIQGAFATWASYANITFKEVASTAAAQIDFSVKSIDGLGNILGETNYSYIGQSMQSAAVTFDSDEGWHSAGAGVVSNQNLNLAMVALHEIGHSLGLDHDNASPEVMNAYLNTSVTSLQAGDIAGIQALYGAAPATTSSAAPASSLESASFSSSGYLAVNGDVSKSGMDPLSHYDQYGWKEGRDPSATFDTKLYLLHNPDVAAAGIDPLEHYLEFGQAEGRQTYAAIGAASSFTHGSFDAEYYLLANPDVAKAALAAGGDTYAFAYQHYESSGWHEGRMADAFFDPAYYLAHNPDVAASGIDPLTHYDLYGWKEGRDPSAAFHTNAYLAANPDVAAAHIDPLTHYLQFGADEGRHLA